MEYSDVFSSSMATAPPPPSYEESVNSARPIDYSTCVAFSVSTDYEHRVLRADRKSVLESNTEFARLLTSGVFKLTNDMYEIHCKTISSFELYLRSVYKQMMIKELPITQHHHLSLQQIPRDRLCEIPERDRGPGCVRAVHTIPKH